MSENSLPRVERLRSLSAIRRLFAEGEGGFVYPFRYMCFKESGVTDDVKGDSVSGGVEVMFSVPKKFHKRANKRNVLKRRSREAYRLHKQSLVAKVAEQGIALDLALVYSTKEILSYKTIEYAVQRILGQVCSHL
ncbi:MAG: ribonuclease P [Rikenellaceae bacterium]|nr:ribonuclease P [Rikenellaceae bacterium]